ncbi:cytochrome P450 [Peniophora sp. CONT]|nr:cytochrome P450 [Peniophora sp. CONT]
MYFLPDTLSAIFPPGITRSHAVLSVGTVLGLAAILVVRYLKSPWRRLPPGPPGLPLIGNALQLKDEQWLLFSAWRKIYGASMTLCLLDTITNIGLGPGDMFYLNAAGQPIIVVNTHSIAVDLLDRRASRYADRPSNIVGWEIMSGGLFFAFGRDNDRWRRMRKASHEAVNKVVTHGVDEYLISDALALARSGLQNPSTWDDHLHRASGNSMLSCLYGEPPSYNEHDSRIGYINEFDEHLIRAITPGAHWVEMLPWLRHIPSRFAAWKKSAETLYREADGKFIRMFECVQESIVNGNEWPSFASTLIHQAGRYGLNTRENAWCTATMFAGGAHTTAAIMKWWTLAMLVYPDVQKRAQRELDVVVGRARTPTFADMPHLPYISAMVKEVVRWGPLAPLGVPHRSTEDDVYEGYFIPKGTIVIPNVWELNRDVEMFGIDADRFNPARYLDEKGQLLPDPPGTKDDGHFTYGFGRRVCVGKHVANKGLFIEIATCLWAFSLANIEGQALNVNAFCDEGLVVRPMPFEVDIQPRFPEALALLTEECELRGR